MTSHSASKGLPSDNRLVFHKIHFIIKKRVKYGQSVFVCGDIGELGGWNPEKAFRLKWNEGDIWSGSLLLANNIPTSCQYKYIMCDWESPSRGGTIWQVGRHNRKLDIEINKHLTYCDDRWNMDRISLNIMIPISKVKDGEKYYVAGEINQLGSWKERKLMKKIIKKNIPFWHQKENIYSNLWQGQQKCIFTYSFHMYRGKEQFQYSYIKKDDIFQGERTPKRVLDLFNKDVMLPNRLDIFHPRGEIFVLDQCKISQITCSQITNSIWVGSYIKTRNDIVSLKQRQISSILSIQSDKDFKKHGLSPHYLKLLCDQFGITYRRYSIDDMSQQDFIIRAEGAIKIMHELLKDGGNLYVYCSGGICRSPQIVSLYLCIYQHKTIEEAIKIVKRNHAYGKPNWQVVNNAFRLIKLKKYLKQISI